MNAARMALEAEQSVLGALLIDSSCFDTVGALLQTADFARGDHRKIFSTVSRMVLAGKPVDPITVHAEARDGVDDELLGYLNALAISVPSARNARRYAELVREASMHRSIGEALESASLIAQDDGNPREKLDRISALFAGLEQRGSKDPKHMGDLLVRLMDRINAAAEGEQGDVWPTHIPTLDRAFKGGLRPGKLIVLAARPGVGKSSFAMHLAMRLARDGLPALFLSQEMPEDELADRAICAAARIDGEALFHHLSDDCWGRITEAVEGLGNSPLWIDDQPALTLADIRAKARRIKGLKLLVVDYLQLCSSTLSKENRTAQVGEISRGLKALSKELGICVLALSQLNRDVEKRPGKRPQLSDLRDSGEIEQDADAVLFLWPLREKAFGPVTPIGLEVAKNRGGKRTAFVLSFEAGMQRWSESTERIDDFEQKPKGGDL